MTDFRLIDNFEQVHPDQRFNNKFGQDIIYFATQYGATNMHDVISDWIELQKYSKLTEIKNKEGVVVSYTPEISVLVNMSNALQIQRQLASSVLLSYVLMLNQSFKTHWDTSYEANGIFGATQSNGYLFVSRGISTVDTYEELIKIYFSKLHQTQAWYIGQMNKR